METISSWATKSSSLKQAKREDEQSVGETGTTTMIRTSNHHHLPSRRLPLGPFLFCCAHTSTYFSGRYFSTQGKLEVSFLAFLLEDSMVDDDIMMDSSQEAATASGQQKEVWFVAMRGAEKSAPKREIEPGR